MRRFEVIALVLLAIIAIELAVVVVQMPKTADEMLRTAVKSMKSASDIQDITLSIVRHVSRIQHTLDNLSDGMCLNRKIC